MKTIKRKNKMKQSITKKKKNEWKLDYGEWQAEENVFYGEYIDYRDLSWTITHWMPLPAAPKEGL